MLTNSDLKQILEALAKYGKKDSQLEAIQELPEEDNSTYLSIVYGTKNYRINLNKFKEALFESFIEEALPNIIDDEPIEDSIKLVRSGGVYDAINGDNVIDTHQIKNNAITSEKIKDGEIKTDDIADNNVTENKLSNEVKSSISKYTHTISASGTSVREIGQDSLTSTITITNKIAYYGDRMDDLVTPSSQNIRKRVSEDIINEQYTSWILNPSVGNHTLYYTSKYNEISPAEVSVTIPLNLRKYFGYVPDNITQNSAILEYLIQHKDDVTISDFSNSVGCTVEIPANGEGKKYAYFAVPIPMSIDTVIQTASQLIFPLGTPAEVTRTINIGNVDYSFTYRLYKSVEHPDSNRAKKVKIS